MGTIVTSGDNWRKVTRERPCPKCGKPNRCKITPDGEAVFCWRKRNVFHHIDGRWEEADPNFKPRAKAPRSSSSPQAARPRKEFPSCDAAVEAAKPRGHSLEQVYEYGDDFCVARYRDGEEKEFRPIHRSGGIWYIGDPPSPLPLYRLNKLRPSTVYITEGEKACEAAAGIGLNAVTSSHGSEAAAKTDWSPLAGEEVVLLPDNDDAGRKYAREVAAILLQLEPPALPKILKLPGLPEKGDIVEFIKANREAPKWKIKELAKAAPYVQRDDVMGGAVVTCLADVETRSVAWLWPDRIPLEKLTVLAGHPGEGKSLATCDIAARVSTGRPWADGRPCHRGSVLIINCEDGMGDTIRPRVEAHGADLKKIDVMTTVQKIGEDGKKHEVLFRLQDVAALEDALKRRPDLKLVIIDPIGSFVGGKTDTGKDNEVREVLTPLAKLAEKYRVAVLVVAHCRKSPGNRADELVMGSVAFTALARVVWHVRRDPADRTRRLFLPGKNNLAPEGEGLAFRINGDPPAVVWEGGPVMMTADDAVAAEGTGEPGRPAHERSEAIAWLRDLLGDGAAHPVEEVKKGRRAAGLSASWRTVNRAATDLKVVRTKDPAFGGDWRWQLPTVPHTCQTPPNKGILACGMIGETPTNPAKINQSCQNLYIREETGGNGFPGLSANERQLARTRRGRF